MKVARSIAAGILMFAVVGAAYGSYTFSETFESYAAGSSVSGQNGFTVTNQTATQTQSVVAVGSYFNGGSNSLKFSDQDALSNLSNLAVANIPTVMSDGHMVFTFDYRITSVVSSNQNPSFTVYDGTTQAIRLIFCNVSGKVKNFNTPTGSVDVATNILSTGVWYRAQITVGNIDEGTYDLRIIQGAGDGIEVIHTNGLSFRNKAANFSSFDIGTTATAGTKGTEYYIDNIRAVCYERDPALLDDFENYTIGTGVDNQNGFTVTNQTATQTQTVVGMASYFSSGLNSLRFSDQDTTAGVSNLVVANIPAVMSAGHMVFTFDYCVASNTQNPTFTVYDGTTQAIRLNFLNVTGTIKNSTSSGLVAIATNVLSTGMWYRAQIAVGDISGSSDTYDLRIIQGSGGVRGTEIINVSGIPFRNNVSNLTKFDVGTAGNPGTSGAVFYIDNIKASRAPDTAFLDDFESYTFDAGVDNQNGYTVTNQTMTQTQSVVDVESYFSSGLKSLKFFDQDTTAGVSNLAVANNPAVMSAGHMVFTFDYCVTCLASSNQNPTFAVYNDATRALRVNFFNISGKVKNYTSTGLVEVATNVLSTGVWYRAQITVGDISGSSDTYDLRILQGSDKPGGTEIINVRGLSFQNNVSDLTGFDIGTAANPGTKGSEFYIDNLGIIAPICVSSSGSDTNSGMSSQPMATIQAALDKAAEQPYYLPPPVMLKDGTCRIDEPVFIEAQHSGITLKAEHSGSAVISGGKPITGWTQVSSGLWSANVSGMPEFEQLFINGERKTRARTPNEGWYDGVSAYNPSQVSNLNYMENYNRFYFDAGQFDGVLSSEVSNIYVTLFHAWVNTFQGVTNLDTENNLVYLASDCQKPITYWTPYIRFIVENYRAALDAPGEWYLDATNHTVYYMTKAGETITNAVAPVVSNLLLFAGTVNQPVVDVLVQGIIFEHCDWDLARSNSGDGYLHKTMFSSAVEGSFIRSSAIKECVFRNIGADALWLMNGCRDNLIQKNHFYDIGCSAVKIGVPTYPISESEFTRRITVDNNLIHNCGIIFHGGCGIGVFDSADNVITHNEVSDQDYSGIAVGWGWSYSYATNTPATNNLVKYNRVGYIGRGVLSDMAGIYMAGWSPGSAAINNIVHDVDCYDYGGHGFYADGYGSCELFESNLVYRTESVGLMRNMGWDNTARNNIFAYCGGLYQSGLAGTNTPAGRTNFYINCNISYCNGTNQFLHAAAYPVQMDYNLYWNQPTNIMFDNNTFAQWQATGHDVHSSVTNPLFVDPLADNFTLQAGSPAFATGFLAIDYTTPGLYGDAAWTGLVQTIDRSLSVLSTESSYIAADNPTANYSGATFDGRCLWNGSTNLKRVIYYRFYLPHFSTVTEAMLRLSTTTNASFGDRSYNIVAITNETAEINWTENTLTWNNAPAHNSSIIPSQAWDPTANPNPFMLSDTALAAAVFKVPAGTPVRTTYNIPLNATGVAMINKDTDHSVTFMVVSTNYSTGAPGFYLSNTDYEDSRPELILIHRTAL